MSQKQVVLDTAGVAKFYKSRIQKLYLPYAIYVSIVSAVLFLIRKPPDGAGWTRGKKECTCWGIAALVFSAVRLVMDPIFMAADSAIYYYYDALFQPLARFILAMWIFQMMLAGTERIEKWARSHCRLNYCMQVLSESSFEIYLTHQFIQLSVWEFLPYKNLCVCAIWVILSIFLTVVNTQMLKIICSAIKNCCKRRLN